MHALKCTHSPLPPAILAQQLVAIAATFHEYSAVQLQLEEKQQQSLAATTAASSTSPLSKEDKESRKTEETSGGRSTNHAIQVMQQTVSSVIPVVYQMLNSIKDSVGGEEIRKHLHGAPWVFVGDRFVQAEQVAFLSQVPLSLSYYTHSMSVTFCAKVRILSSFVPTSTHKNLHR